MRVPGTFLKKIMYFLLHTFSLTPKHFSIHTLIKRTFLVISTACVLEDSCNTHALFVNDECWSVPQAIRELKKQENCADCLNIRNMKLFELLSLHLLFILKYILNQRLLDFYSSSILLGDFYLSFSKVSLLLLKYHNWVLFPPLYLTIEDVMLGNNLLELYIITATWHCHEHVIWCWMSILSPGLCHTSESLPFWWTTIPNSR